MATQRVVTAPVRTTRPTAAGERPAYRPEPAAPPSGQRAAALPRPVMIARAPAMASQRPVAAPVRTTEPTVIAAAPAAAADRARPVALSGQGAATLPQPVMIAKAPPMASQRPVAAPASTAQPTMIAKAPTPAREVAAVEQGPAGLVWHTVRPGQELGRIARAYRVSPETLAAANGLREHAALAAGSTLRVPIAKGALYLDGSCLARDVPTVFVGGIAAGPFRHIVEGAGGAVVWSPADHSIGAKAFDTTIRLWVGKAEAQVDGRTVLMDLATFIEQDRAMVPLRFFRDALNYTVSYEQETGRIYIARR